MRCFETPQGPTMRALEDAGYSGRDALHLGCALPERARTAVNDLGILNNNNEFLNNDTHFCRGLHLKWYDALGGATVTVVICAST